MEPVLNVATAFSAGVVSFISPCVLPLMPAYLSFLTGSSLEEMRADRPQARMRTVVHALFFSLGFSVVFIAAGLVAGSLGGALNNDRVWLARIGGIMLVILGLNMLGVLRIGAFFADRRLRINAARRSFLTSFFIGIGFAAGWSPCIGPILAGILVMASTQNATDATLLLGCYSLGLALPLLLTAVALGSVLPLLARLKPFLHTVEIVSGLILVAGGVVLLTGSFSRIASIFSRFLPAPGM